MPAPTPRLPAAFAALLAVRLSLRTLGFRRTLAAVRRFAGAGPARSIGTTAGAARAVATAAAFFPGRAICLEQSLVLFTLLRRRGHPVALRLGVQPFPFQAHAWVEVGGRPVFENADGLAKFVPFPKAFA